MKQLVVISGKGGTGKTIIAASIATLAQNKVMVDCDVDAANLYLLLHPEIQETHQFIGGKKAYIDVEKCTLCGECMDICRFEAIAEKEDGEIIIDPISCDGCGVCTQTACCINKYDLNLQNSDQIEIWCKKNSVPLIGKIPFDEEVTKSLVQQTPLTEYTNKSASKEIKKMWLKLHELFAREEIKK